MTKPIWNSGSEWHRWDPHIHVPGTLFNDQFKGDWDGFLDAIEKAAPIAEALGITDYCVLNGYKEFRKRWEAGRAQNVKFIFPNIEFRLSVETEKKKGVNLHLLFSPDDVDHIAKIERALSHLTFSYKNTKYRCIPEDLVSLGKAFDSRIVSPGAALEKGAEQFKVTLEHIKGMLDNDTWAAENCVVAVITKEGDGTAGLQKDSAFDALQEEIKGIAHIIFSALPSDREFWLGRKAGYDRDVIERMYGGLKPCLHGSDAHEVSKVLKPDDDRFCWIRAELSFTGLKQTLLEPDLRVAIGAQVPAGPAPSECIRSLSVTNAPWLGTTTVELNDGLVAIIGPKGSGKTALADMIACVAGAAIEDDSSFLLKAQGYLGTAAAQLGWGDGTESDAQPLEDAGQAGPSPAGVRYLSQRFVDRLCSSDNLGAELLAEIEAVVFEAIPEEDRLGATSFAELRDVRLEHILRARASHLDTIQLLSATIAKEDENKAKLPAQETRLKDLSVKIVKDEKDLGELLPKEKKAEAERLARVQAALEAKTKELQQLRLRANRLQELEREYARLRGSWQKDIETLQELYKTCGLTETEWSVLEPVFEPDSKRAGIFTTAKARVEEWVKTTTEGTAATKEEPDLAKWSLKNLQELQQSLTQAVGVEKERAKKHTELSRRLSATKQEREKLEKEVIELRGTDVRRRKAIEERRQVYASVFETLVEEQVILDQLYAPLKAQLAKEGSVEKKLEFYVRRRVDVEGWVKRGEALLDLRKAGTFKGHGTLEKAATEKVIPAWKTGGAAEVATAMDQFITTHMRDLMAAKAPDVPLQDLGRWLFSTDHINLEYGIRYDGVDVSRLSPGMRGIVLLILYLAVDQWDTRPLLVDQPEENLDPHSVYEELVKYFRSAKRRRQVILVTHNPNLVVNADADQVIIATSERQDPKSLPNISYTSGGLEDKATRSEVCRILEGGERAFRERERRYSIHRNLRRA